MVEVNVKARYFQLLKTILNLYSSSCVNRYEIEIAFFENCDEAVV